MNKFCLKKLFLLAASASLLNLVACDSAEEIVIHGYEQKADIKDGKLVDPRDGNKYGVAQINGVYWMTENLRYADSSSMENLKGNSWCHEDDKNCSKFGRLYSWTAAMDADKKFISSKYVSAANPQGICPSGWRLPTRTDWSNLINFVSSQNGGEGSGTSIKSTDSWNKSDTANAPTNRFGFNAKASGRRNNDGETFLNTGRIAVFWTSEDMDAGTAYGMQLRHDVNDLQQGNFYKDHGLSVRCMANLGDVKITGSLDSSYLDKIPHHYGSLKYGDETYRTVDINGLTWMADNMNYELNGSHCYKDDKNNCKEYGRLYTLELAKKVCPENWRLPTANDFAKLTQFAKTNAALRSSTGWTDKASKGLNFWGFDAKPAGGRDSGDYFDLKTSAYFWINGESTSGNASVMWINYYESAPITKTHSVSNEFSVRCVQE